MELEEIGVQTDLLGTHILKESDQHIKLNMLKSQSERLTTKNHSMLKKNTKSSTPIIWKRRQLLSESIEGPKLLHPKSTWLRLTSQDFL